MFKRAILILRNEEVISRYQGDNLGKKKKEIVIFLTPSTHDPSNIYQ